MGQRGMTLVEIAIVLAILGIAAALAIPSFLRMTPHINLKNAASEVADDMTVSRMRSISEGRDYTLSFDLAGDTYTVVPEGGGATVTKGTLWKGVDLYGDMSDPGVKPFSGNDVAFRPNGTAATAGYEALYLRNRPATAERYRVKVLGATGKVGVEKWKGGAWISAF